MIKVRYLFCILFSKKIRPMSEVPIISKDYFQQFKMLLWLITKLEFSNPMERLGVSTVKPKIDMEFAKDVQKVNIQSD